jgi:flavin reductase (DIM6/NTAB) family NADH-FMN oxidoreductase RutF
MVWEPVDAVSFKRGMRQLAGAVTIVAVAHEGSRCGFTATAVCSLSDSPPSLLTCINRQSDTLALIRSCRRYTVNVLHERHRELAQRFSGFTGVNGGERFEDGSWVETSGGSVRLDDSLASFECALVDQLEVVTHVVAIGMVRQVWTSAATHPLLYAQGVYTRLAVA